MSFDPARSRAPHRPHRTAPPRTFAVGRKTLAIAGSTFALLAAWSAGSAWYILFRDQLALRYISQQAEMQYSYEAKIGALRARLDRVATQKLLEHDGIEGRITDLVARQVELENRQAILATLAENADVVPAATPVTKRADPVETTSSIPNRASAFTGSPKPRPAMDPIGLRLRGSEPQGSEPPPPNAAPSPAKDRPRLGLQQGSPEARLDDLALAIDRTEASQLRSLDGLLSGTHSEVARLRSVFADAGVDPSTIRTRKPGAVGGPLVPLAAGPDAGPFETMAKQVHDGLNQLSHLRQAAVAVPFKPPTEGDIDLTSGFGYRLDPFTRSPAMHTGLDFRADHGSPVRATAGGRVVAAEYSGGYGNLVEIQHEGGISTRYAHLSAIAVNVGQVVQPGAVIGRVGSTGRSTGPHLHYEIRVDDTPINPSRFLRAGKKLAAIEQR